MLSFLPLAVLAVAALGADSQTTRQPKTKPKTDARTHLQPKNMGGPVQGFAVAPIVLTDEGCVRDYIRAFQFEGVELRKRLADLERYGCVDTTAKGVFVAAASERRDFSLDKEHNAYFRLVVMQYHLGFTQTAVGDQLVNEPGKKSYCGWIMDQDFYAVSPEEFGHLLAEKKIPISTHPTRLP